MIQSSRLPLESKKSFLRSYFQKQNRISPSVIKSQLPIKTMYENQKQQLYKVRLFSQKAQTIQKFRYWKKNVNWEISQLNLFIKVSTNLEQTLITLQSSQTEYQSGTKSLFTNRSKIDSNFSKRLFKGKTSR